MTAKTITDLSSFTRWATNARSGAVATYHYSTEAARDDALFAFARDLSDQGKVFLFQRRDAAGHWEHCALRITQRAAAFINRVSALVAAPPRVAL